MLTQQVLALSHIDKSYGTKTVLDAVSLLINQGDRIALVGENGVGKSTLASIIMGELPPDNGRVSLTPGTQIGYLPQEAVIDELLSVQAYLERALGGLDTLRDQLEALEAQLADSPPSELAEIMEQYGALQEQYAARGGYEVDQRLDQVLNGLDLGKLDRARPMLTLSGGEKTRVMLASLLLGVPDVLILDEPTNHLDFKAVAWLEGYLKHYPGALLFISHDRRFLNVLATEIAELTPHDHKLTIYHGNYDQFMAERERLREKQQAAFEVQHEERKRLTALIKSKTHNVPAPPPPPDGDIMAYKARGENFEQTTSHLIRNAKQRLHKLDENAVERPTQRWQINPEFEPEALGSRDVIRLKAVSKTFGSKCLFSELSGIIAGGQRVVLVGANGAGKTTLLKVMLGLLEPDTGSVQIARGARIGYLDQEQETLPDQVTVLDEFSRGLTLPEAERRSALHKYGLFKEEQVFQPIHTLSVGQRRKLQIARLIALKANVLLLDEPTNHLDLESVARFEGALLEFPGTIIATSHDRLFIERVATQIWTFEGAGVVRQTTV